MHELLFLGVDDKIPTYCETYKFDNQFLIMFKDENGVIVKRILHEKDYDGIKKLTMEKFLDSKFIEDVKTDRNLRSVLDEMNNNISNSVSNDFNDPNRIGELAGTHFENSNGYMQRVDFDIKDVNNIKKIVTASRDREEYIKDMQDLYRKVMEAESVNLTPIMNSIFDQIIDFMKTLTDNDKDAFYADLRSRIDSEFYGKIVISKEEFENFKKYEKIIKDIKAV